jgi:hypothetical protein
VKRPLSVCDALGVPVTALRPISDCIFGYFVESVRLRQTGRETDCLICTVW